eukprot:3327083-Amphidinium_carterae.1
MRTTRSLSGPAWLAPHVTCTDLHRSGIDPVGCSPGNKNVALRNSNRDAVSTALHTAMGSRLC